MSTPTWQIRPLLQAYDQTVQKEYDAKGKFTGNFSHTLRVYLIDRHQRVRNIYSVSFLHADTLINDAKTMALESTRQMPEASLGGTRSRRTLRPGDDKTDYTSSAYRTDSVALPECRKTGRPHPVCAKSSLGSAAPAYSRRQPPHRRKNRLGAQAFL